MAQFGWIDFSPKDRQRVGTILELMKPSGQVDELGVGTIRDALADQLFRGISTVQTRAKYFFIIPYILQDFLRLSAKERSKTTPNKYLDDQEHAIMWDLAEKFDHNDRLGSGVIGITKKRGERIVRRPSEVYWNGLNVFKCIDSKGLSANAFLNHVHRDNQDRITQLIEDDNDNDYGSDFENYFNIKSPVDDNWRKDLDLNLTQREASFLKSSMRDLDTSLLALLVSDTEVYNEFKTALSFLDFAKICVERDINKELKAHMILAHDFSEVIEGAHIAYNQELQTKFFFVDHFAQKWNEWYVHFKSRMIDAGNFDPEHLFVLTGDQKAGHFVREWWKLINAPTLDLEYKSQLLRRQEFHAKGNKARVYNNKRTDVKENKRIGLSRLEYRFSNARTIINDIYKGLTID